MPGKAELCTDDNGPIPVLRRAPVLSNSHGECVYGTVEDIPLYQSSAAQDTNTHNGIPGRSLSRRISRVATTTLGRSLSESLRRSRSTTQSQSRVQPARQASHVKRYRDDIPIRKVHDNVLDDGAALQPAWPQATTTAGVADSTSQSAKKTTRVVYNSARDPMAAQLAESSGSARSSVAEVPVPVLLQQGVPMTKVTPKSQKSYLFKIDADQGQIIWESKRLRISTCVLVGA